MKREEIESWIEKNTNFKKDRYGNFVVTISEDKQYRIKMNAISLRFETKIRHEAGLYSAASVSWIRLEGDYYSAIKETESGCLKIGKRVLKKTN